MRRRVLDYHNIHVVYTKEAETADQYIEKFTHENGAKYDITVATSDGLEQIIIRGQGCRLLSARDLKEEIRLACGAAAGRLSGEPADAEELSSGFPVRGAEESSLRKWPDGQSPKDGRTDEEIMRHGSDSAARVVLKV